MRCAEFLESTFDDPSTALKDYLFLLRIGGGLGDNDGRLAVIT